MVLSPPHHPSSSEDIRSLLHSHTLPAHEGSPGAGVWSVLLDGVRRRVCRVPPSTLSHFLLAQCGQIQPSHDWPGFLTGPCDHRGIGRAAQACRVRIPQGLSYSVASAEDRGPSPRHQNKSSIPRKLSLHPSIRKGAGVESNA